MEKEVQTMTAKEYLLQYKRLTARIQNIEANLEELREERSSLGINLDGLPHGSGLSDRTARLAAQLVDTEYKLLDLRSEAWSKRLEIVNVIGRLQDPLHVRLLHLRYIEGKRWENIAVDLSISWRYCFMVHGAALEELDKILSASS